MAATGYQMAMSGCLCLWHNTCQAAQAELSPPETPLVKTAGQREKPVPSLSLPPVLVVWLLVQEEGAPLLSHVTVKDTGSTLRCLHAARRGRH